MEKSSGQRSERLLFLRRSLAEPLRVAALLPSSPALADLVARQVPAPGTRFVLELGAGTGAVTEALAKRVPEEQLILVEIDEQLCACLRRRFPRAQVIRGDVAGLAQIVPARPGEVAATVSGLPVTRFSVAAQRALVEQSFALTGEDGVLLQYSYMPFPPLRSRQLGLRSERVGFTPRNLPPLFVWRFTRAGQR